LLEGEGGRREERAKKGLMKGKERWRVHEECRRGVEGIAG
jgi:hypothetical protein